MLKKTLFLAALALVLVSPALAQVTPPAPGDKLDLAFLVSVGGAVATYLVTFGFKKILPKIPKLVFLAIPLALGAGATAIAGLLTHATPGSLQYLALGAVAVLIDNVLKYAQNPS